MNPFKTLFKSTSLSDYDIKIIGLLKEALQNVEYQVEFNRSHIIVKVKRE